MVGRQRRRIRVVVQVALMFFFLACGWLPNIYTPFYIPPVSASAMSFAVSNTDGFLRHYDADYGVARNATVCYDNFTTTYVIFVGQQKSGPFRYVNRAIFPFDTSSIPDDATVTGANLSLGLQYDYSTVDFNVTIMAGNGTRLHDPVWKSDYHYPFWEGAECGERNTATMTVTNQYYNITFTNLSPINKTGVSQILIRSSLDIANSEPTPSDQRMGFYNATSSYPAKLYVEYEYGTNQKILWVHQYDGDAEVGTWVKYGDTPYLENNTENYVYSFTGATRTIGYFQFNNTDLTTAPDQVWLAIEWRIRLPEVEKARLFIHNGTADVEVGNFTPAIYFRWYEYNISDILDTMTKVVNAKLKIQDLSTSSTFLWIRRCYLRVYYGPYSRDYSANYGKANDDVTLSVKASDPDGVSTYAMNHNATGSWQGSNITGSLSGGWANVTVEFPSDTTSVVAYRFWFNDTNDNWERLILEVSTFHVYVVSEYFNINKLIHLDNTTSAWPFTHSYGRKDFYGLNTDRFWKFYNNGSHFLWTSTTDGLSWNSVQVVKAAGEPHGYISYYWLEDRASTDYIHYVYCEEALGDDVYYRRGILASDGSITWVAEQTVVPVPANHKYYSTSVVVDTSGYPYVTYANYTVNMQLYLSKSQYNNGSWSTAAGFPVAINTNPDGDKVSGTAHQLPNGDIYVIYATNGNDEPVRGRLYNGTLQAIENASNYNMDSNYLFSAISENGNVHVAYRWNASRLDYSYRNSSGIWEIKDEVITEHVTDESITGVTKTWPIIGWDAVNNETYVNWCSGQDYSVWLQKRNETAWTSRERVLVIPEDTEMQTDPNLFAPYPYAGASGTEVVLNLALDNILDGTNELYAYLYSVTVVLNEYTETFTETVSFFETSSFYLSYWKLSSETVTVTADITTSRSLLFYTYESTVVSEANYKWLEAYRGFVESPNFVSQLVYLGLEAFQSFSETVQSDSVFTKLIGLFTVVQESVQPSSMFDRWRELTFSTEESTTITGVFIYLGREIGMFFSESVATTSQFTRFFEGFFISSETLVLSESGSFMKELLFIDVYETFTETVNAESIGLIWRELTFGNSESAGFTSLLDRWRALFIIQPETASFEATLFAWRSLYYPHVETASFAEQLSKLNALSQWFTESASVTDGFSDLASLYMFFSETVNFAAVETFLSELAFIQLFTVSEAISPSTTEYMWRELSRTFPESFVVSESLGKYIALLMTQSETVAASSVDGFWRALWFVTSETAQFTESLEKWFETAVYLVEFFESVAVSSASFFTEELTVVVSYATEDYVVMMMLLAVCLCIPLIFVIPRVILRRRRELQAM